MENNKTSLNSILEKFHQLEEEIINNDGEIDERLELMLENNSDNLKHKFDNYEKFIRYLNGQIDYLKSMEAHYSKRRKVVENSVSRCKNNLVNALKSTGNKSIRTADFNFTLCKSEKWSVNLEFLNEDSRKELLEKGLAEEVFKPLVSKIKVQFKDEDSKPEWIDIEESDYIKVS